MYPLSADIHIGMALLLVSGAIVLYALDYVSIAVTSLIILGALLIFYSLFPVSSEASFSISLEDLLKGFGNPALIAVLALLVVSQGLNYTAALDGFVQPILTRIQNFPILAIILALLCVAVISGFLNNTPVVLMFIPIMQQLAAGFSQSPSRLMMPLSFAAILGGMTTLIGSSTNLLVSSSLNNIGLPPLHFFDFTVPGVLLAATGILYVLIASRYLLVERASFASEFIKQDETSQKLFLAEIRITTESQWVGEVITDSRLPNAGTIRIHMIQRGERAFTIPFHNVTLNVGDVLIVFATKKDLSHIIAQDGSSTTSTTEDSPHVLTEVMVTPASRLVGQTLERLAFRYRYKAIVLGLQRRGMVRQTRLTDAPLEAGDILLLRGAQSDLRQLHLTRDMLTIENAETHIPSPIMARRANYIFLSTIALAASEVVPIVVAAIMGATAMLLSGVLNIRRAARAIDPNLFLLIGSSLALGTILLKTGAAALLAEQLIHIFDFVGTAGIISIFFLLVAIFTNLISNNACAVIFTPVAISIANAIGADPMIFAITVIFAANCCFVTPIGYQTNILVMGVGHYRFADFVRFGAPLTLLLWIVFSIFAPFYYDL